MTEKGNNISKLVNETITKSIEFEKLMDRTDFESWLKDDSISVLEQMGQEVAPFENYEENRKELRSICEQMKQKGINNLCKTGDKSSLEKYLVHRLFEAKAERLNARISYVSKKRGDYYEKGIYTLLDALIHLQNWRDDKNCREYWLILYYNDLSICYAELENSFISQGYAEKAKKIIEKKSSYKKFKQELNSAETLGGASKVNHGFASSKLYVLYIIAVFNRAKAEKLSYQKSEAERGFKRIIDYAIKSGVIDFNYYSTLVNLSDLYIDQNRCREALELLNKVTNSTNENDIRYWKAYLTKIGALIDRSEYCEARKLLFREFIEKGPILKRKKKHRITWVGFKALGLLARSYIEEVKNSPSMSYEDKERKLGIAEKSINSTLRSIKDREQEGFKLKSYKYLSNIHTILYDIEGSTTLKLQQDQQIMSNLILFISMGNINDFSLFVDHKKKEKWIDECEDLDVLESFSEQICKTLNTQKDLKNSKRVLLLLRKIVDRIKRECEDKDFLARVEKTVRITRELLEEAKVPPDWILKNEKNFSSKKCEFFSCMGKGDMDAINIVRRLDVNEKKFDEFLFGEPGKMKKTDHLVEVIVLRRWNSFSPGLSRRGAESLGGGYLLRIDKNILHNTKKHDTNIENIAIDPGYNFLRNLWGEGFSVEHIDTIIVTHSHLDHCSELLPMMDLIFQINKRHERSSCTIKSKKKVNLCLSRGAYEKFLIYTGDRKWQEQLKDIIILENLDEKKWQLTDGLVISAIPTHHEDLGGAYAIGLKIGIAVKGKKNGESRNLCLGFTSDTPWYPKIREDFQECDLLCVHVGSINHKEIGYTDDYYSEKGRDIDPDEQFMEVKNLYNETGHLLCFGTEDVITSCVRSKKDILVIVGEFGEELKYGLREDLCKRLCRSTKACCIPGDIGLYVGIGNDGIKKVRCNFCEEFVLQENIATVSYGREDALQYICQGCESTLSPLQKQADIEHRLTKH